jgi:hypothetical protein
MQHEIEASCPAPGSSKAVPRQDWNPSRHHNFKLLPHIVQRLLQRFVFMCMQQTLRVIMCMKLARAFAPASAHSENMSIQSCAGIRAVV